MKPVPDINAPCLCSASRKPYELPHDAGCRWAPMSAFADLSASEARLRAAIDSARRERDTRGPGSNGARKDLP